MKKNGAVTMIGEVVASANTEGHFTEVGELSEEQYKNIMTTASAGLDNSKK